MSEKFLAIFYGLIAPFLLAWLLVLASVGLALTFAGPSLDTGPEAVVQCPHHVETAEVPHGTR